jgi:Sulfotransferase domain
MKNLILKKKEKIFCIGANKTGTTSVEKALKDLGFSLGNIPTAELFFEEYSRRNFNSIIKFCKTADAFQDAPFSFPYTFIPLDIAYPNSKFILTIRDSDEQWYNSLIKFHSKIHSKSGNVPTEEDLKNSTYRYKGFAWDVRQKVFGIKSGQDVYDKKTFLDYYNNHNKLVLDYFKFRDNLLVINLSNKDSYFNFCKFLNKKPLYAEFPWENKTSEIK